MLNGFQFIIRSNSISAFSHGEDCKIISKNLLSCSQAYQAYRNCF